ncbi:hypothetical protein C1T31_03250 [Hanstruepera neustonica]|uniref:Tissue inhibitor of metalloproteinase n=1 Tax=Hanstruepera neustonica TaxID=1445657 RepID=A0A2K1E4F6_9FLAO|nr:hypothetical protein [Hanstruepera neustonica]PNQ75166.1 hypothetical protein C1T31_03250 [Hanstruepera neustonica]
MKNILTILFIICIQQVYACVCRTVPLIDRIESSDFIAKAKILKVTADDENNSFHNIEIEIIDIFKGENLSKLKIYSALNSSCGFFTPENTTWLIFAKKDENGILSFGYCSGAKQIDRKFNSDRYPNAQKGYSRSIEQKIELLEFIKQKNIDPKNEFKLQITATNGCLKEFRGIEVKNEPFALYELTINNDLSIKNIKPLKEFDNSKLKSDLLKCISKSIKVHRKNKQIEIERQTKIIFALYYYPSGEDYESFIGKFNL